MNYIELQGCLQNLIKKDISRSKIADILDTTRQNINKKFNNPEKSEVSVSELQKIEEFYGVSIYKSNIHTLDRQNDTTIPEKIELFGKRLTELQDKHEYLDKDMAKLLRISEEEYIDIKLGDAEPDFNVLVRLKQCFKVSIDWLLFGE